MDFDLENEGVEFPFNPLKPEEGSLTVRLAPKIVVDDIVKRTTNYKKKWRAGQLVTDAIEDTPKQNKLLWDYQIVDWQNVRVSGEELECNMENKYIMMMKSAAFARHFLTCMEKLSDEVPDEEEEIKNSGTQSMSTTQEPPQDLTVMSVQN